MTLTGGMNLKILFALIPVVIQSVTPATGTVIVYGFSKNKIVIASDSRATNEDGSYLDDFCKITELNKTMVFTVSGRFADITGGRVGWDADLEAKRAIAEVAKRQPNPKHPSSLYFVGDTATLWVDHLRRRCSSGTCCYSALTR